MWKYVLDTARKFWAEPPSDQFAIEFERAVHRLASDPTAPSIANPPSFEYFGDDLLRYVPPPDMMISHAVRTTSEGGPSYNFLDSKDWEPLKSPLSNFIQFRLAHELAQGVAYRDTKSCRHLKRNLAKGLTIGVNGVRLDTEEKIDRYCEYVQWLIDSVRENGLRSRHGASHLLEQSFTEVRRAHKEAGETDILVAVDARGEILRLNSGRHRLAVAHALGLKEVPVKVQLVHVGWIVSLMRETGARSDIALRQWLRRFRSAVEDVKVRLVTATYGLGEYAEMAFVLA